MSAVRHCQCTSLRGTQTVWNRTYGEKRLNVDVATDVIHCLPEVGVCTLVHKETGREVPVSKIKWSKT